MTAPADRIHPPTQAARDALASIGRPRVLIVGDLILDRYVSGAVSRISPEAPIPVLAAAQREERLGGAGNVAANLRSLGAEVECLGVVGSDGHGRQLSALLEGEGCEVSGLVIDPERPTTVKTRMISGVQQIIRIDWEEAHAIPPALEDQLIEAVKARLQDVDGVILSDYGKGVLTERVLRTAIEGARARSKPVLVDPKGSDFARYRGATLLTPNRKEAEEALGEPIASLEEVPVAAEKLRAIAGLECSLITLGGDGIYYLDSEGHGARVPTMARAVFDVTGAGDTVISLLGLGLASGCSLGDSVALANHAAGLVVARRGAASVTRAELKGVLGAHGTGDGKLLDLDSIDARIVEWRRRGQRIAFTNGCFDVLHAGHVQYLRFARSKGDRLVVGVNDDESVRRLKGPSRPVNPIGDRLAVLEALEMVDGVIAFGQDTPLELIQRITPDALVKGEDWAEKGVVGREHVEANGGEVHLAPLLEGRSTTAILGRTKDS